MTRSKKRSAASSLSRLPEQVFFVDRSLGRVTVPSALRDAGAKVVVHDECFDPGTPDEAWLAEAGRRGWVVLTQDQHIRYRATELRALTEAGVLAFVIVAAGATGDELGQLLVRALRRLRRPPQRRSALRCFCCAATASRFALPCVDKRCVGGDHRTALPPLRRHGLAQMPVKIGYDIATDTLRIVLSDAPIAESDEDKPGVIFDYDADGNIVGIEVLQAFRRIDNRNRIESLSA